MNGTSTHLKLKGTALAASVPLFAPAAAYESSAGSTTQGGWGWWDAAIGGGALLGIVLLGFFGDLVIGAVIFGIWSVLSGGATLVAGIGRAGRARAEARTERRRAGAAALASDRAQAPSAGVVRRRQRDEVAIEVRRTCDAQQLQRSGVVVTEQRHQVVDTDLATGHEGVQIGARNKCSTGSERNGNRDVSARSDTAVQVHLGGVADCIDHTRKQLERGHGSIQLTSTVVGDRKTVCSH